jgi:hypothetical protein
MNSFLPHFSCLAFALLWPRRLAALLTFVMRRYNKPNDRLLARTISDVVPPATECDRLRLTWSQSADAVTV